MNTIQANEPTAGLRGRLAAASRNRYVWIGAAVLLVGLILLARGSRTEVDATDSVFGVKRGPLIISVTQPGTLQSREEVRILCEVPGNNTILWVIEEGTPVQEGDVLMTLDASQFEENLVNQQIVVENADADLVRSKENYQVMKLDETGEIAQAELTLRLAQMDLAAYENEEFPQKKKQVEADITIAEEEIQRARDKVDWSTKLADEGYLTRTELQADDLARKRAELNLELAQGQLRTLEEYSNERSLEKLRAQVDEAERSLDRVRHKHKALFVQAEADIRAKESELERQRKKLENIQTWIVNCTIKAPVSGMVVYSTTGADRHFRRNNEEIAEGVQVRERQHLISLPTAASMVARARVYESSIEKVKKGMPARITVDSLPGVVFKGTVDKIGILPEAEMGWMSSDLKSYAVDVNVEGEADGLRPGMNCSVEIVVAQFADALYIPLQAVVHLGNQPVVYRPHRGGPEAQEVEIGLDNQSMVRIISGLEEGDRVLMAPPIPPGTAGQGTEFAMEGNAAQNMPDAGPAAARPSGAPGEGGAGVGERTGMVRPDGTGAPGGAALPQGMSRPDRANRSDAAGQGDRSERRGQGQRGQSGQRAPSGDRSRSQ